MTAGTEPVLIRETRGAALWLTINRPERRNAMNGAVIDGIADGLRIASGDPAIRAVVITGVGDRAFCAGADLAEGPDAFTQQLARPTTDFGVLARQARMFEKPIIARLGGACVAGGVALMSMCDLVVAADHVHLALPEVRVGVFPMQVAVYLKYSLTSAQLAEFMYLGERIDVARAVELGLINRVVPADALDDAVSAMVDQIALGSPQAIARGRVALGQMAGMTFDQALGFAETQIAVTSRTSDAAEGIAAFGAKRKPAWQKEA